MAFNIKDPEADRLLRELAATTGESMTEAARRAFAERLQRAQDADSFEYEAVRARLWQVAESASGAVVDDAPTDDEIIGYDESGVPA
ncbi:type II toxin-antitoxin system VapB family antitoxin [Microbacterium gubbeenense]|uniref:type II toxin-antitoxin system VapB family antitoxin n=1 Tax=Microbacterium gubbeenense TaxID=159896 RepID=UPI003F9E1934